MADMSRNNSTNSFQGFSVCQPTLGAVLQWLPALGSRELDDLINALLPGPASMQDKRAHISMDFFQFSRQTGENFKFYPVCNASFTSGAGAIDSPASSSALYDSGYGSSLNVSPAISDMSPWTQSATASTSASTASDSRSKSRSFSKKTVRSSSRQPTDLAGHPGMRIMTRDGRDVTNSASRGCKSKEQRDHAHLMRIIKACDACRRKKIRCDPSHKKRGASQTQPSQFDAKQIKKARKAAISEAPTLCIDAANTDLLVASEELGIDSTPPATPSLDSFGENVNDIWEQFVHFDEEAIPVPFPDDYNFSSDPAGYLRPSDEFSFASPAQFLTPFTPSGSDHWGALPDVTIQQPTLPYLNSDGAYGTNYVDFNLYSPASDFLDEEPLLAKRQPIGASAQQTFPSSSQSPFDDAQHTTRRQNYSVSVLQASLSEWVQVGIDSTSQAGSCPVQNLPPPGSLQGSAETVAIFSVEGSRQELLKQQYQSRENGLNAADSSQRRPPPSSSSSPPSPPSPALCTSAINPLTMYLNQPLEAQQAALFGTSPPLSPTDYELPSSNTFEPYARSYNRLSDSPSSKPPQSSQDGDIPGLTRSSESDRNTAGSGTASSHAAPLPTATAASTSSHLFTCAGQWVASVTHASVTSSNPMSGQFHAPSPTLCPQAESLLPHVGRYNLDSSDKEPIDVLNPISYGEGYRAGSLLPSAVARRATVRHSHSQPLVDAPYSSAFTTDTSLPFCGRTSHGDITTHTFAAGLSLNSLSDSSFAVGEAGRFTWANDWYGISALSAHPSTGGNLLLSVLLATRIPLPPPMRTAFAKAQQDVSKSTKKLLALVSLWHVVAFGLVSCLLVSNMRCSSSARFLGAVALVYSAYFLPYILLRPTALWHGYSVSPNARSSHSIGTLENVKSTMSGHSRFQASLRCAIAGIVKERIGFPGQGRAIRLGGS